METSTLVLMDGVMQYCRRILAEDLPEELYLNNRKYTEQLIKDIILIGEEVGLSEKELELAQIAGWFYNTGFRETYDQFLDVSKKIAVDYLKTHNCPAEDIQAIINILDCAGSKDKITPDSVPAVFCDALHCTVSKKKFNDYLMRLYNQEIHFGKIRKGRIDMYDMAVDYLQGHRFYTVYANAELEPKKQKLLTLLKKEKKNLRKIEGAAFSRDLNISEIELKSLKQKLKHKGRNERGIQTMFRLTSRNHFTLNQMVDRKANIMISINAIVLSVLIGGFIGNFQGKYTPDIIPVISLVLTCLLSILLAVLSIRPEVTHGQFSEEEVRQKQGNLLFYGNFHEMSQRDYEWAMLQMLNDRDYLYTSMIRDIYYLGHILNKKNRLLRSSLNVFMIGLVISVILFMIFPL